MTSLLGVCVLIGCGRSATPTTAAVSDDKPDNGEAATSDSPKSKEKTDADSSTAADKNRRMIGDIPLDVFFDDPIAVASQTGEVGSPAAGSAVAKKTGTTDGAAKPTTEPMPAAENTVAKSEGGATDWAAVISGEDLQDEVKKLRLRLQENLSAVGKYNGHYDKEIRWDGAGLAALAALAMIHPDKVSWKDHAGQIRDAAKEMIDKSKVLGPVSFEATKKEFEKIDALLGGNPPPGLPPPAEGVTFSDVAPRKHLMQCISLGGEFLRANFQAASSIEKKSEEAAHAASLVATYTKVIATDGYNSVDEAEYKGFVKALLDANLTMAKAAREKDFDAFTKANGPVPKICSECHLVYKGNGSD